MLRKAISQSIFSIQIAKTSPFNLTSDTGSIRMENNFIRYQQRHDKMRFDLSIFHITFMKQSLEENCFKSCYDRTLMNNERVFCSHKWNDSMLAKVLVVEDAKIAQKIAQHLLEQLGCGVDIAENGKQALQLVHTIKYDLILMDLGLGDDFNGFQVTEAIRKIVYYQKVPIVMLTAHIEEHHKTRAHQMGMDDFLLKPLSKEKAKNMLIKFGLNKA